jgi:hypothetical protein
MAFCSTVGIESRFIGSTLQPPGRSGGAPPREPVIVLAHHPVLARIGETLPLGRVTELSRLAPSRVRKASSGCRYRLAPFLPLSAGESGAGRGGSGETHRPV